MLAQAMSSTKATAPCSMNSDGFMLPTRCSCSGTGFDALAGVALRMRLLQLFREEGRAAPAPD